MMVVTQFLMAELYCYKSLLGSQRTLTMFAGVVPLCYQHCVVLITECHNFRKHNESPVTNFLDACSKNLNTMVQPISFYFTELAILLTQRKK